MPDDKMGEPVGVRIVVKEPAAGVTANEVFPNQVSNTGGEPNMVVTRKVGGVLCGNPLVDRRNKRRWIVEHEVRVRKFQRRAEVNKHGETFRMERVELSTTARELFRLRRGQVSHQSEKLVRTTEGFYDTALNEG